MTQKKRTSHLTRVSCALVVPRHHAAGPDTPGRTAQHLAALPIVGRTAATWAKQVMKKLIEP